MPDLSQCTIHLAGHAHIDLGYRWRWNETVHRIARDTFRGVLRMMDETPDLIFVQSQLALYEAMEQHYPDIFQGIKQRIAEGRWIVVDGWCEYDHMMTSGEAMIRQHLIASRYARQRLDCAITMAWAPDAFSGHAHTLPSILKGCGIGYMLFGRGMPQNMPFFRWEGPDGAQVLSYTPVNSYSAVIGPGLLTQMQRWQEGLKASDMFVLYGRGDHGGGPRRDDIKALADLRERAGAPRLVHTTPQSFFQDVLQAKYDLPVYRGELGGGSTGAYTSEARSKQRARQIENLLVTTERFATLATYFQRKPVYPRVDSTQAWKTVLHHNFHDELPGTSRAPVYEDIDADFADVEKNVTSMLDTALAEIGNRVDTRGEETPILVFNPLSWERVEPVQVRLRLTEPPGNLAICGLNGLPLPTQVLSIEEHGRAWYVDVLFVAEGVPGFGYRLFRAVANSTEAPRPGVDATATQLDNQFLRVTIDPATGQISSLYSKYLGRDVLAAPGNVLQAIAEKPGVQSAWIIALANEVTALAQAESVELIESGPVRATVRATYRYGESFFTVDTILRDSSQWLEVRVQADWQERECCIKTAFPLAISGGEATFEAPYGYIERPADGAEVMAQNWLDVSTMAMGVTLLSNARYGCDVKDSTMRLTLLRGIPDLDPRADQGEHDVRFGVFPHRGTWRWAHTQRRAQEFNLPLIARQELRHSGMMAPWLQAAAYAALPPVFSFAQVSPDNILITALKVEEEEWGEWSPVVLRLYESIGRAADALLTLPGPLRFCEETNHLEEPLAKQTVEVVGNTVRVSLQPNEVKTLRLALVRQSLGLPERQEGEEASLGIRGAGT